MPTKLNRLDPNMIPDDELEYDTRIDANLIPDDELESEQSFADWYQGWAEKTGISPDPDDPRHKYDYRAAYQAGAEPEISPEDNQYHWPSEFKADDHPNRYVDGIDTKTGKQYQGGGQAQAQEPEQGFDPEDIWSDASFTGQKPELDEGPSFMQRAIPAFGAAVGGPFATAQLYTATGVEPYRSPTAEPGDWEGMKALTEGYKGLAKSAARGLELITRNDSLVPNSEDYDMEDPIDREKYKWDLMRSEGFNAAGDALGPVFDKVAQLDQLQPDHDYYARLESKPKFKKYMEEVVGMAPQMASQLAAHMIGGPATSGIWMALQIAGAEYDSLIEQGADPNRAMKAAWASALSQAPLEMLSLGLVLRNPLTKRLVKGGVAKFALGRAEGAATEWLTETFQQIPAKFWENWAQDPDFIQKLKEDPKLLKSIVAQGFKEGMSEGNVAAFYGAIFGIGGDKAKKPKIRPKMPPVTSEVLRGISADLKDGTLTADDIETMRKDLDPNHPLYAELGALIEEPAAEASGERLTDLEALAARQWGEEGKGEFYKVTNPKRKSVREVVEITKKIGLEAIVYRGKGKADGVNGLVDTDTGQIYINETATDPYAVVVGHESLHQLKVKHRDLYDQLVEKVKELDIDMTDYLTELNKNRKAADLSELTAEEALATEEYLADFVGSQFKNKEFWQKLNKETPSAGRQLAQIISDLIEKIKAVMRKGKSIDAKAFKQMNDLQDAVASVYEEFTRRESKIEDATKTTEPVAPAKPTVDAMAIENKHRAADMPNTLEYDHIVKGLTDQQKKAAADVLSAYDMPMKERVAALKEAIGQGPARGAQPVKPAGPLEDLTNEEIEAMDPEQRARAVLGEDASEEEVKTLTEQIKTFQADQAKKEAKPVKKAKESKKGQNVRTFRGAVLAAGGIKWGNQFKGERKTMAENNLGAVYLTRQKTGMPWDTLQQQLRDDGWLGAEERLIDVLNDPKILSRGRINEDVLAKKTAHLTAQEREIKKDIEFEAEEPPPGDYQVMAAEELPVGKKLTIIEDESTRGWDVYTVVEKDPFGVTLKDGITIELAPGDKVQVKKTDVAASAKKLELKGEKAMSAKQAELRAKKRTASAGRQQSLGLWEPAPKGDWLKGEKATAKEAKAFEGKTKAREGEKAKEIFKGRKPHWAEVIKGGRQNAIEYVYRTAYEAANQYPGTPFKDLVSVRVLDKAGEGGKTLDIRYATRENVDEVVDQASKDYPKAWITSNYDLTPYSPKKGEIAYRKYALERDKGLERPKMTKPAKPEQGRLPGFSVKAYKDLDRPEKRAFNRAARTLPGGEAARNRIRKNAGTAWEGVAIESMLGRQALQDLLDGKPTTYENVINAPRSKVFKNTIIKLGEEGLWHYVGQNGILSKPGKPLVAISGSYAECDPSKNCVNTCYAAAGGRRYPSLFIKNESVNYLVNADPARAAEMTSRQYKMTLDRNVNKALRMFDRGEAGGPQWVRYIEELNKQGVRAQIFSKKPEFIRAVPDFNLTMLSIDSSNTALADANPDLDLAVVYQGEQDLEMLEKYKKQIRVILPIIINKRPLSKSEIAKLPAWAYDRTCPIDAGYIKVGNPKKGIPGWHCRNCDHGSGEPGCFFGKSTDLVFSKVPLRLTDEALTYRIEDLKKYGKEIPDAGIRKRFNANVDILISEILRGRDPGAASTVQEGLSRIHAGDAKRRRSAKRKGKFSPKRQDQQKITKVQQTSSLRNAAVINKQGKLEAAEPVYSAKTAPLFYSKMEDILDQKLPNKAPAKLMLQAVKALANKGEFKAEEYKWSGLEDYLEDQLTAKKWQATNDPENQFTVEKRADGRYYLYDTEFGAENTAAVPDFTVRQEAMLQAQQVAYERRKGKESQFKGYLKFKPVAPGKVTKQQVLNYLQTNNIKVEELEKGSLRSIADDQKYEIIEDDMRWSSSEYLEPDEDWIEEEINFHTEGDAEVTRDEAFEIAVDTYANFDMAYETEEYESGWAIRHDAEETTFEIFDENGEFVEHLDFPGVTLENVQERVFEILKQRGLAISTEEAQEIVERYETKYKGYSEPGGRNYRELLLKLPEAKTQKPFFAEHYPDDANILAHVRYDQRIDADSHRTIHIAEIQSDWHQKGRKIGYQRPEAEQIKKREKLFKELEVRLDRWREKVAAYGVLTPSPDEAGGRRDFYEDIAYGQGESRVTPEDRMELVEILMANDNLPKIGPSAGVPDAPFKGSQAWSMLAIKRMVRYAAEHGFDAISWDVGETQVRRYKEALQKAVDTIKWEKTPDGIVLIGTKNGREVVNTMERETAISDAIGKTMGDAIIESKDQSGQFEGDEITISDTGMAGFYDRMLVNEVKRFFGKKAWGKAKVTPTTYDTGPGEKRVPGWVVLDENGVPVTREDATGNIHIIPFLTQESARDYLLAALHGNGSIAQDKGPGNELKAWKMVLTPEMKTKATAKGMPLFSTKKAPAFYSQMQKTLGEKLQNKGTAEQYLKTIKALANKGDFKTEELEWSGVEEYLEDQKHPSLDEYRKLRGWELTKNLPDRIDTEEELRLLKQINSEYDAMVKKPFRVKKEDLLNWMRLNEIELRETHYYTSKREGMIGEGYIDWPLDTGDEYKGFWTDPLTRIKTTFEIKKITTDIGQEQTTRWALSINDKFIASKRTEEQARGLASDYADDYFEDSITDAAKLNWSSVEGRRVTTWEAWGHDPLTDESIKWEIEKQKEYGRTMYVVYQDGELWDDTEGDSLAEAKRYVSQQMESMIRNEIDMSRNRLVGDFTDEFEGETDPKHADPSWRLPYGTNYQELLLSLPAVASEMRSKLIERIEKKYGGEYGRDFQYDELTDAERRGITLFSRQAEQDIRERKVFTHPHWEIPNVLAHTRMTDRIDAEGRKTLFLEEVQSDWHQKGRREGYKSQLGKEYKVLDWNTMTEAEQTRYRDLTQSGKVRYIAVDPLTGVMYAGSENSAEEALKRAKKLSPAPYDERGAPDAPFKKSWPMLIIKRMVRWAANEGYDALSWTPGDVQNKRYDLSKHVTIEYAQQVDGRYWVHAKSLTSGETVFEKTVTADKLVELAGKETADKIIAGEGKVKTDRHHESLVERGPVVEIYEKDGNWYQRFADQTAMGVWGSKESAQKDADQLKYMIESKPTMLLEGPDLQVGGEPMRVFYDKVVRNEVNKFFDKEKWGNSHVEVGHIKVDTHVGEEITSKLLNAAADEARKAVDSVAEKFLREQARNVDENKGYSLAIFNSNPWPGADKPPAYYFDKARAYKDKYLEVWTLPITPQMKDKALTEGMPLFSVKKALGSPEATDLSTKDYSVQFSAKEDHPGNKVAENFNAGKPGIVIRFDGEWDRSAIDMDPMYQFTVYEGPGLGATFVTETLDYQTVADKYFQIVTPFIENKAASMAKKRIDPYTQSYIDALKAAQPDAFITSPDLPEEPDADLDKEIADALEASKGLGRLTMQDKLQGALKDIWYSSTRHRPYLDPKEYSDVANVLRLQQEVPANSVRRAGQVLTAILSGLKPKQYKAFAHKLLLDDMMRDIESGLLEDTENLPFGFNLKAAKDYLAKLNQIIDADPVIQDAIERRGAFNNKLKRALVDADLLPEAVMDDDRYFHHQVLQYRAVREMGGEYYPGIGVSSKDVRLKKKGWQRGRIGSHKDYNSDYAESEFEVIAQAISQLETKATMQRVQELVDEMPALKSEAKAKNLHQLYVNEAERLTASDKKGRIWKSWEVQEEADPLSPFKAEIAKGLNWIGNLAKKGKLYSSGGKDFTDVIEALDEWQDEVLHEKIMAEEDGRDPNMIPFPFDELGSRAWAYFNHMMDENHEGAPAAGIIFRAIRQRNEFIKEYLGKEFKTAKDLMPEGYTAWVPQPGTSWYKAYSLSDRIVQAVQAGEMVIGQEEAEKIRTILARGKDVEWIIPIDVAKTLDGYDVVYENHMLSTASRKMMTGWKQWILINPYRVVKYNLNNLSGDLDISLAYDPKIVFKYGLKAARDLYKDWKGKKMPPELQAEIDLAYSKGVLGSGWSVQEVGDVTRELSFDEHMQAFTGQKPALIKRGWRSLQGFTNYRENILRLAAFRYFQDRIAAGEKNIYAASNKKEVDGISDPIEKAAKLARELIGDYGNITHSGQWLRRHLIPFYAWMEVNAPRYVRLIRNVRHEGQGARKIGRALPLVGANVAWRGTKLAMKATAIYVLANLWNRTFFPDEDDELGEAQRRQLHIILGRRDDGSVVSLRFQGALSDALAWFGGEDIHKDVLDVIKKKATAGEKVKEALLAPVIKIIHGIRPDVKAGAELLSGMSYYPDPFNPRPIYDKLEHVTRLFSLNGAYAWLAGKPKRGDTTSERLLNDLMALGFYNSDPGESAYYDIRSKTFDYLDKIGMDRPSRTATDKGTALHYYKQGLKYGDLKAAEKYLGQYFKLGGTSTGITKSIKRVHPLGSLAKKKRRAFLATLSPEEKERYDLALRWYNNTYLKRRQSVPIPPRGGRPALGQPAGESGKTLREILKLKNE